MGIIVQRIIQNECLLLNNFDRKRVSKREPKYMLPMMKYVEEEVENLVAVTITDTIEENDIKTLIPEMEKKISIYSKINFYLEIRDGVAWEAESLWSNMNFNLKHAQDIKKVAFVGDEQLEENIIDLLKPLANAEIRWYTFAEKREALKWLKN